MAQLLNAVKTRTVVVTTMTDRPTVEVSYVAGDVTIAAAVKAKFGLQASGAPHDWERLK